MRWDDMCKNETARRVAVIGGGLAGLSAAHRLNELATERGESIEVTLFEAGPRLGGLVGTERIGEYLIDVGADSFLTNKPAAVNLCRRLGIEDRLVPTDARFRGALVLRNGRPVPIPDGFQLLSPTAIWPIITSPLFSVWGKVRLLMEWFVPGRPETRNASTSGLDQRLETVNRALTDESLSDFVLRRFGREALDRLIQPLVGGIYTADPKRLSLAATMPRFLEMERDHGSLIRASIRQRSGRGIKNPKSSIEQDDCQPDSSSGARYGLFAGLKGGMSDLVEALRAHAESACSVRLNSRVVSVAVGTPEPGRPAHDSVSPEYVLTFSDGEQERFAAVIVAVTAARTATLLETIDRELSDELRKIEFASSAIVVSGHRLADVRHPLTAFGLVIPHSERRQILAVSFSSRKFPDRAPADRILLRTFVGGALQPEMLNHTDEELIEIVRDELDKTLGVRGEPDFIRVYRYDNAMPQYHVGHLERVARIEGLALKHPRMALAGIACRGVGIPDAIASGKRAAEAIVS